MLLNDLRQEDVDYLEQVGKEERLSKSDAKSGPGCFVANVV